MDEPLFTRLAERLARGEAVALASVRATRGAVPRTRGSRMLIGLAQDEFSVGGGEAEARVVAAARRLLAGDAHAGEVGIDLSGRPGSAGVCGGDMRVVLSRWQGEAARARALALATTLQAGVSAKLAASELGDPDGPDETLLPNERLLIVGGGHCGEALCTLARPLAFDIWVHDARPDCFAPGRFEGARTLCGPASELRSALDTARPVYAVLLNRDFPADVAALRELAPRPPAFWAMMGSRKRIGEVRAALPEHAAALETLVAPVGIEIGAETPHEIAVSILAQLIAARCRLRAEG